MKAVLLSGVGGRDVLKVGEADKPSPAEGQALIKVKATSVNRADIVQRQGNYPPPKGESEILGLEVAGVIDALGPGVSGWKVGERVMCLVGGGGYAEYAVAYASHLIRIPDSMSFEQAACVCETYITAFLNIFLIGEFKDGQAILLHGGGGGVNTAGIQLCKVLTPKSKIVVTASPKKVERVKALGADLVINYKEKDFAEEIRAYTDKRGVDLILDHIGADYLAGNQKALATGGALIIIGVTSGIKSELNLGLLLVKRQRVIGSVIRARSVKDKAEITAAFTKTVMPKFADGTLKPIVDRTLPLDDVAEAHRLMEESQHFGKIVLSVGR